MYKRQEGRRRSALRSIGRNYNFAFASFLDLYNFVLCVTLRSSPSDYILFTLHHSQLYITVNMSSMEETMTNVALTNPETIWLVQLFLMIAVLPMTCLYLTSNRFSNKTQDETKSAKTSQAEKVLSSLS